MQYALLLSAAAAAAFDFATAGSPWPVSATTEAEALVEQMSMEEKYSLLYGHTGPYDGNVPGVPRLGIPSLQLQDGASGVATKISNVTCFPSSLTLAATWDTALASAYGGAICEEEKAKGANVWLAPYVNLQRVPWGGRAYETLGEDPVLVAAMAAAEIQGCQSRGVCAVAKHLSDYNDCAKASADQSFYNAVVPHRAQMELYTHAFRKAVEVGVASVMCSYNQVNGTQACEDSVALSNLRATRPGGLGFRGWVVSDWNAAHSTVASANAGLDMEMPKGKFYGNLSRAVDVGNVSSARIDQMVTNILTPLAALKMLRQPPLLGNLSSVAATAEHASVARAVAEGSLILVRNAGNPPILPLSAAVTKSIAVIGDESTVVGVGSGTVQPPPGLVTPAQGIQAAAGTGVNVSYLSGTDLPAAVDLAREVDVVVVVVATNTALGHDYNLSLPRSQNELVRSIARANPRTIAVARCPGPCATPWSSDTAAVLLQLMGGQGAGAALGAVLFGKVNPSGKLPFSSPATVNDTWLSPAPGQPWNPRQYPGYLPSGASATQLPVVQYSEGLFMGYRYYDAARIQPEWSFGHGLSFSTFEYTALQVRGSLGETSTVTVSFTLRNVAGPAGKEVAQLYLSPPAEADEPPQLLRAFAKVLLRPQEQVSVSFSLTVEDVRVWDTVRQNWRVVPGRYGLGVGSGSRDVRLRGSLVVDN